MSDYLLLDLAIRPSFIVFVGLVASAMSPRGSAAMRHCALAAAIFGAAAVAPLNRVLPAWDVPMFASTRAAPPPDTQPAIAGRATLDAGESVVTRPAVLPLLLIVWVAGIAASAAVLLTGLTRLVWLSWRAEPMQEGDWARTAARVAASYGLRRPVRLLRTHSPDLLGVWGLFRPSLLLPADAREWREERIHAVLCHELAHIRRHDWIVQMAAEVIRSVYWFNPLLWHACRRLRRESEQACDDAVLHAGIPAPEYAAHLLELATICRRAGPVSLSAALMAHPSTLERRISAMLNPRIRRGALSARGIAVTALVLIGVTLPAAAFRAGQQAPLPLSGAVYDPSGAVLPQVELTLEDAQQVKWQATTDAAGRFEFPPVPPGQYVLEASLIGFGSLRHQFDLRNASDWDRAITLQVGEVRETIHVRERRVAGSRPKPQAQGALPVRVGGNIRAPRKLRDVRPVYPATMRNEGREGVVPMEAIIGLDGTVTSVHVLSAQVHPDFALAAVDAVRQWRFDATLLNGVAVEVVMTVSVAFSLAE
jgi:TonB family protein